MFDRCCSKIAESETELTLVEGNTSGIYSGTGRPTTRIARSRDRERRHTRHTGGDQSPLELSEVHGLAAVTVVRVQSVLSVSSRIHHTVATASPKRINRVLTYRSAHDSYFDLSEARRRTKKIRGTRVSDRNTMIRPTVHRSIFILHESINRTRTEKKGAGISDPWGTCMVRVHTTHSKRSV